MGFPKNSMKNQAVGRSGEKASDNPVSYVAGSPTAGENGITAGAFAWKQASDPSITDIYTPGVYTNSASKTAVIPDGLVSAESLQAYVNSDEDSTMLIQAGQGCMIAQTGDWYVKTTTKASIGQGVFAVEENGTVKTDVISATVSGAVFTGWTVTTEGEANSIIMISKR